MIKIYRTVVVRTHLNGHEIGNESEGVGKILDIKEGNGRGLDKTV
jgi:hypothetical protein